PLCPSEASGEGGLTPGVKEAGGTLRPIFIWQGGWHGGAERVTASMAHFLANHGFAVTLGVFKRDASVPHQQITFRHLTFLPRSFRSLAASLWYQTRYAHDFPLVYTHTLGAWKTKTNRLFIHEAADLDVKLQQAQGLRRKLAYRLWRWLYLNLCLKRATALFAATPECAAYLARQGIPHERIIPSSSFYDEQVFRFVLRPAPAQTVNIIFIGNYQDPAKNFAVAHAHFHRRPSFTVTVAGGQAQSQDANFRFLGYLPPSQLFAELAAAHIFFMPSTSEGFSISLLEALATGIPCLVSRIAIPTPLYAIRNIIPYDDDHEIQPAINDIVQHYELYNQPADQLQRFSQSIVLQIEYERILNTVS
ncbi:MAG: glycosyltransferase family 4 protein, partial [Candidatus Andersenbacteria bacterium]|nr:glycosyltransferase family 4 protein [Candidatus Andersenbacteria bacterium]